MKKFLGYLLILCILPTLIGGVQQICNGWGFWTGFGYTFLGYVIILAAFALYSIGLNLIRGD